MYIPDPIRRPARAPSTPLRPSRPIKARWFLTTLLGVAGLGLPGCERDELTGPGAARDPHPTTASVSAPPSILTTISVANCPQGIAVSPGTGRVYVTSFDAGTVTVIDATTNSILGAPVQVGAGANHG